MNAILFIINVKEDEIVDETRNPQWVCLNLYPNIWELNNWSHFNYLVIIRVSSPLKIFHFLLLTKVSPGFQSEHSQLWQQLTTQRTTQFQSKD